MPAPVKMPKFGLAMTEGTVLGWLAAKGARIHKGQTIAEIETAKAVNPLEAPATGVLAGVRLEEGAAAAVGETIGWILLEGESAADIPQTPSPAATQVQKPDSEKMRAAPAAEPGRGAPKARRALSSPAARRLAAELGVDLSTVAGTGPDGSIIHRDVLRAAEGATGGPPAAEEDTLLPLSPMRREIASHVAASAAIPQIALYSRADASALRAARRTDDAILFCVARTLRDHKYLNASFEERGIRLHAHVNIGFPVSVKDGLVIPVIREADKLSLAEITTERKRLVDRVRSGRITGQEISGGTFTISNLSMYPIDRFAALISPPQAAILSVGRIQRQPVALEGDVAIRPIVEFGLTLDHRVADGVAGAKFLKDLIARIESLKVEETGHD